MSNMPSIDKTRLTMRIDLKVRAKLRTYCRDTKQTENDVLSKAVEQFLAAVEASPEDRAWVEEERKRNERMRRR